MSRLSRTSFLGAVTLAICSLLGCGARVATVSGKITLDGEPIANGTISFFPADGATTSAETKIKGGYYTLQMPPGRKRVQISAMKVIGKRVVYEGDPNSPVVDNVEEQIPPQYNAATTLTFEAPAGKREAEFRVEVDVRNAGDGLRAKRWGFAQAQPPATQP